VHDAQTKGVREVDIAVTVCAKIGWLRRPLADGQRVSSLRFRIPFAERAEILGTPGASSTKV
jgi:hypothetical protein